ncbi:UDP-N-acetylenolpyruvoylglucosamine reductase [Candidatus Dependentiae bacterium]|nr:MAG: UDP-N-acetylenolpyruvoylglucosamine reductase [Candidatus Dependentiae bacterium]
MNIKPYNIPPCIQEQVSLAHKNWFGTGGKAEYFLAAKNRTEIKQALAWAKKHTISITILGYGANILISDDGIQGLVVTIDLQSINHQNNILTVDAGVSVDETINYALDHNLGGLEFFTSIPGSMGGATCMNIHYFNALLSDYIQTIEIIDLTSMETIKVDKSWSAFGYNQSKFLSKKYLIIAVTLKLEKLTDLQIAYARGRSDEIRRQRSRRYPPSRTCGSFFQNFSADEYKHAHGATQVPYVAFYLESVGVKGQLSSGKASVFHLHANMITTKKMATSEDICKLAHMMQEKVYKKFGLWPKPECQLLGFKQNMLIKR